MPNLPRERLAQIGREQNGAPERPLIDADYLEGLALHLDDAPNVQDLLYATEEAADALRATIKVIQNLEDTIASVRRVNALLVHATRGKATSGWRMP